MAKDYLEQHTDEVIDEVLEIEDEIDEIDISDILPDPEGYVDLNDTYIEVGNGEEPEDNIDSDADADGNEQQPIISVTQSFDYGVTVTPIVASTNNQESSIQLNGDVTLEGSLEISKDGVRQGGVLYLNEEDKKLYTFGSKGDPIEIVLEPNFDSKGSLTEISLFFQSNDRVADLKKQIAKLEEENDRLKLYSRFDILDIEEKDGI